MRTAVLLFCLVAVFAVPASCSGRSRRAAYPQRAMMFSGYFGRPVPAQYYPRGYTYNRPGFVTRGYEPQGAMTAFAAGNTVAAGSGFYGGGANDGNGNGALPAAQPDCSQCNGAQPPASAEQPDPEAYPEHGPIPPPEEHPESSQEEEPQQPPPVEADDDDESELPKDEPAPPPQPQPQAPPASGEAPQEETGRDITPKNDKKPEGRPPRRRPIQDDDDDDDDDDVLPIPGLPGKRRKGTGNSYNSFFPMVFGSYPGSRSGGEAPPGVATAIANSFSTGKGAVATSHATAYGGPHLLGNGSNGYRKNGSRARLTARS